MSRLHGKLASFEEMQRLVYDFEDVLKKAQIAVAPGSDLEWICLNVFAILAKMKNPTLMNPLEDIRRYFIDVLGLWTFMVKIVRLQGHRDFGMVLPHLRLLNQGKVPQNSRLPVTDQASDKIFELLIALCAMAAGEATAVDDPDSSKGDNPDVLATIDGVRWGFACKVIYGRNPRTLYDNIVKAVAQIEASEAERGCVIVNFKNQIDHQRFWPILNEDEFRQGAEPVFGVYPYYASVPYELSALVTQRRNEVAGEVGLSEVQATFAGKKAVPGFVAFSQTATAVASSRGPLPVSIDVFTMADFDDVSAVMPVLQKLSNAMHDV